MVDTAQFVFVKDLLLGTFFRQEGWNRNYVEVQGRAVTKANLFGIIVSAGAGVLLLDDGTGVIELRDISNQHKTISVGEIVQVTGRPRMIDNVFVLVVETLHRRTATWKGVWERQKKVSDLFNKIEAVKPPVQKDLSEEKVMLLIEELDTGAGADLHDIILRGGDNAEQIIETCIKRGELFSPKPGKIKKLN